MDVFNEDSGSGSSDARLDTRGDDGSSRGGGRREVECPTRALLSLFFNF